MYLHTHHTCKYRMEYSQFMLLVVRAMHEEIDEMPLRADANYEVDLQTKVGADQGGRMFNIVFLTLAVDHLLCSVGLCYLDWKR